MSIFTKEKIKNNGLLGFSEVSIDFISKLKAIGGIAYVVIGVGFFIIVGIIFESSKIADSIVEVLLPVAILLIVMGTAISVTFKVLEHSLLKMKLRFIISVSEKIIEKKINSQTTLDTTEFQKLIGTIRKDIWGLDSDEGTNVSKL